MFFTSKYNKLKTEYINLLKRNKKVEYELAHYKYKVKKLEASLEDAGDSIRNLSYNDYKAQVDHLEHYIKSLNIKMSSLEKNNKVLKSAYKDPDLLLLHVFNLIDKELK